MQKQQYVEGEILTHVFYGTELIVLRYNIWYGTYTCQGTADGWRTIYRTAVLGSNYRRATK